MCMNHENVKVMTDFLPWIPVSITIIFLCLQLLMDNLLRHHVVFALHGFEHSGPSQTAACSYTERMKHNAGYVSFVARNGLRGS